MRMPLAFMCSEPALDTGRETTVARADAAAVVQGGLPERVGAFLHSNRGEKRSDALK